MEFLLTFPKYSVVFLYYNHPMRYALPLFDRRGQ